MRWRVHLLVALAMLGLGLPTGPVHADAPSPGARLGTKDESSEYWDVTAVLDSGHRIFVRFSISNEGPGERTGYALGQIVFPDGRVVPFDNGRTESDWTLSDDRMRMKIGSSVLDLHPGAAHFEVDKNRQGVKVFLDYRSPDPVQSWESAPAGYHFDLVTLAAPVRGTIWVREVGGAPADVKGTISVTHAWMDQTESDLLRRRIEAHLLAEGGACGFLVDAVPTRGAARHWLVVRRGGGAPSDGAPAAAPEWWRSDRFSLDLEGRNEASKRGYPVPQALVLSGAGVSGRIEVGRHLLDHDPLSVAPLPFRLLLSFRTRPRQVWLESTAHLTAAADDRPITLEAHGPLSVFFMNPLPTGGDETPP